MRRDTSKRGYTVEQVLAELERRDPDSRAFIRPQREHADIAVRFTPPAGQSPEEAGPHLDVRLTLGPTIPHPDLRYLIADGAGIPAIRVLHGGAPDRPVLTLEIDGSVTAEEAARLEAAIWRYLPELASLPADQFGNYLDLTELRHSDPLALTQLLLTCHLLRGKTELAYAEPVAALSRLRVPAAAVGPPPPASASVPTARRGKTGSRAAEPAPPAPPMVPRPSGASVADPAAVAAVLRRE
jgi:phosphoribulokinase